MITINPNTRNYETELLAEKETNHRAEIIKNNILDETKSVTAE